MIFRRLPKAIQKEATAEAQQILEQKEAENIARGWKPSVLRTRREFFEAIENLQDKFDSRSSDLSQNFR